MTRKTTSNVGSTSSTGRPARHARRHAGAATLAEPITTVCLVTGANRGRAAPPPLAQPAWRRSIGIELSHLGRLFLELVDELVKRLLTADVVLRFAHHVQSHSGNHIVFEIAERIRAEPGLRLRGIAGFEGLIRGDSPTLAAERVRAFLALMVRAAEDCARRGLFADEPVILTAGGSAYYDLVAEAFSKVDLGRPSRVVLRSGCYLTHDHHMYENYVKDIIARSPMLSTGTIRPTPALEVWASVQSVPEPGLAICSVGKRDISFDVHLPMPVAWCRLGRDQKSQPLEGHVVTGLNDQHAMVRRPADSPLKVGDLIGFGVSHPCTTFDRWPLLYVIDEGGTVLEGVRTFF